MAEYSDASDQQSRHRAYPDCAPSIVSHDLQPIRLAACAKHVLQGETVLDVGCNSGYYIDHCPQAAAVYGVDVNPELVAIARRKLHGVHLAPAESLPFRSRTFDVVNLAGVLELVHDPIPVVLEAARVAKRLVTGSTCHADGSWGRERVPSHAWHARSFDLEEISYLLAVAGRTVALEEVFAPSVGPPQCWAFAVEVDREAT